MDEILHRAGAALAAWAVIFFVSAMITCERPEPRVSDGFVVATFMSAIMATVLLVLYP